MVYKMPDLMPWLKQLIGFQKQLRPCLLCDSRCLQHGPTFIQLCADCRQALPYILNPCFICGIELPDGSEHGAVCAQCQQRSPLYTRCLAPFHFNTPVDSLIHGFKDNANFAYGRVMSALLAQYIDEQLQATPAPDCLVALPLHRSRLRSRGFNQSILLANTLANSLGCPLLRQALLRQKPTQDQKTLSRKQRRQNIQNAFQLSDNISFKNKHIALIDDVVTSQATVNEASRILLRKGGAARVDIYCLARVDMRRGP